MFLMRSYVVSHTANVTLTAVLLPMGPSPWPSWNAQFHGHLHEGRPLYIHTAVLPLVLLKMYGLLQLVFLPVP